ncbi:MAG: DNA gyrase inhibitor YacG [Steroidobacteraceae bacterium]
MATLVKCPTCGRPVEWSAASAYRPFCSDRCRLIDLGAWLDEKHRIAGEPGAADSSDEPQENS